MPETETWEWHQMKLRMFKIAAISALLATAGLAAPTFVQPAAAAGPVTGLWYSSTTGYPGPSDHSYSAPTDTFSVSSSSLNQVTFDVLGNGTCSINNGACDNAQLTFGAPFTNTLAVGNYTNAIGVAGQASPLFYMSARGTSYSGGAFTIDQISFSGSNIQTLSARFTLHSYFGSNFEGQLSYNSTANYTPLSVSFTQVPWTPVGAITDTDITITNSGPGTRTGVGTSATITDDIYYSGANGFSIFSNTCSTLTSGQSCTIKVRFAPTAAIAYSAHITFNDGIRDATEVARLNLNTRGQLPYGNVVGDPSFGQVRANFYDAKTMTVKSSVFGTPLVITDFYVTGENPDDFDLDPESDCFNRAVPADQTCTIDLYFTPTGAGYRRAVINFVSNAQPAMAFVATGYGTLGYTLVTASGASYAYGDAAKPVDLKGLNKPIVGVASTLSGDGTWRVATDGGIFTSGDAVYYGSTGALKLNQPIVGIASTPTGLGYWLVASDGGIFSFGDASFFGSTGGIKLNKPIVGMAPSGSGNGYWLVASDGGIFAFGDAAFKGSTGAIKLNQPIVGMAPTITGNGYWLVASDGGIFSFGDATFFGSAGATKLNSPITSMIATPSGKGYWFVAKDGGVFSYGDATFIGSAGASGVRDVVGISSPSAYY